jgi:hypothetical protein
LAASRARYLHGNVDCAARVAETTARYRPIGTSPYESSIGGPTERFELRQVSNGLEHVCLARTILSDQNVDAVLRFEAQLLVVAKLSQLQPLEMHAATR